MAAAIIGLVIMTLTLLWSVIDPKGMWRTTASWQFRNPEANEPSESAYAFARICSLVGLVGVLAMAGMIFSNPGNAQAEASASSTFTYIDPWAPSTDDDGYAEATVEAAAVDPFPSAVNSDVGSGEPVTLFAPVLTDPQATPDSSDSSRQIGVEALYYPWLPGDHPSAFAAANVIDSKVALGTLDAAQATTAGGGEAAIGEGSAIILRLSRPVCAVTSVRVREGDTGMSVDVSGISDPSRCGQTTEGAYVAVPLTEEQVAKARAYVAPAYHPRDGSGLSYGGDNQEGEWAPTAFSARMRAKLTDTWSTPEQDGELTRRVLLPWTSGL